MENPENKLLPDGKTLKKARLWLEGLRCFRRNFRAWVKWALVVWLLEIVVLIPLFWHGTVVDKVWLSCVAAFIPIAAFFAFFIQQEPIVGVAKFPRKHLVSMLRGISRIFLSALPIFVGAIMAMNLQQILDYFGFSLRLNYDDMKVFFAVVGVTGIFIFKWVFCYFLFRIFQFLALFANNVVKPLEFGKFLNQGNFWRLARNFCALYFADFLIDSIGQVSSIYFFVNLAQWLLEMGIGSAMEVAGVFLTIVALLYYTAVLGVFIAFASAATRILNQEKLRDDPAFRLVLNRDAEPTV